MAQAGNRGPAVGMGMRGPATRFMRIALAAAGIAAAAPASAAPATSGYEEGLAAYQKNDYEKSLKVLRPLAEKGDARAQYLIGRQYQFGQAVKADRAEAFYWYKRAEAKGHVEAKLFRLLLEKRWKISTAEKSRAERALAADSAPKPPPAVAQIESRPKPRPDKAVAEAAKAAEKSKPEASPPERAARTAPKREVEAARPKAPEPPKAETARVKPEPPKGPERPATVAARTTVPDEATPSEPPSRRSPSEIARATPRPPVRHDEDHEDEDGAWKRRNGPPPESRTTIAAVPTPPPPGDDHSSDHAPYYGPGTPGYAPSEPPPVPYYAPGPAPYYAPAAPPSWRPRVYYGPRPYYGRPWGYRTYADYGWRNQGWRGPRGRW